jgi:thiol-disulfide isomerase/thioredoxin
MLSLKPNDFSGTRLLDARNILTVFYASWCPFCKSFLGTFEGTMIRKTDPQGALVDISDENNPLWETFKIDIVPTLVGFRDGVTIARKDGIAGEGLSVSDLQDVLRKLEKS